MTATSSHASAAVQFDGVSKAFDGEPAVADISLKIEAGAFTVFVGPSGCGKSTILAMAAGLQRPSSGDVFVDGRAIDGPTPSTALIFQDHNLFPWKTALGNVAFGLMNRGLSRSDATNEARRLLAKVGLAAYADKVPNELSGGMRQRVALIRAFALEPRLLLLDEPFAALDHQTRRIMQAYLLATWRASNATVLMVTHDLNEALLLADRIVLVSGSPGRICAVIELDAPRPRSIEDAALRDVARRLEVHLETEVARGDFSAEELVALSTLTSGAPADQLRREHDEDHVH